MISRRLPPAVVALALAVLPAAAGASTVSSTSELDFPSLVAGPGEVNSIVVSAAPGGGLAFTDSAGVTTTDPADPQFCRAETPTRVVCPSAGRGIVDAGDGDDRIENQSSLGLVVKGGPGSDVLLGGPAREALRGDRGSEDRSGAGPDQVSGGGGDDEISGEGGNDRVDGGEGNDTVSGAEGDDTVLGGLGNDQLENFDQSTTGGDNIAGDTGNDTVDAGPGNDLVMSTLGRDRTTGGDGNDALVADNLAWVPSRGAAKVDCGRGRDTFFAGHGDVLAGCERLEVHLFCNTNQASCRPDFRLGARVGRSLVTLLRRAPRITRPAVIYVTLPARASTLARRHAGVNLLAQFRVPGRKGFAVPLYDFTLRSHL